MKRHNNAIKFLSLFLIGAFLFSSCSDWFDESPKTDLKADKMFENEEGFQNALTGIYLLLTSANTYAGNMSFGLLDQLAQEYDYEPDGDRKSTRLNSSHANISYAVFCLK